MEIMAKMKLEEQFNKFIESGILDENEFQEYEICITQFDNKISGDKND